MTNVVKLVPQKVKNREESKVWLRDCIKRMTELLEEMEKSDRSK
jgi:hypothetical protein